MKAEFLGEHEHGRFGGIPSNAPAFVFLSIHNSRVGAKCPNFSGKQKFRMIGGINNTTIQADTAGRLIPHTANIKHLLPRIYLLYHHLVFGNGSSFINCDNPCLTQGFNRLEFFHQHIALRHSPDTGGKH